MGLTSYLAGKAGVPVKCAGGLELIAAKDAEALLHEALVCGCKVTGVEGFRIERESIVPDMNAMADFSSEEGEKVFPAETISMARRFVIEVASQDTYFDFVIENQD